jgi:ATP-dependent Clp protease adaptor protein ClpS
MWLRDVSVGSAERGFRAVIAAGTDLCYNRGSLPGAGVTEGAVPQLTVDAPAKPVIDWELVTIPEEELEKLHRVTILNDDVTTFEFVIRSLVVVFELDEDRAEAIAWETHTRGQAYVATLPLKEAQEKVFRVQYAARQEGYPLEFLIEPEE